MTAFDALMPGALDGAPTVRRAGLGGSSGDWRQAVEQAQTKSWLGDRNVDAGRGPLPDGREAPSMGRAEMSPTGHALSSERDLPSTPERSADTVGTRSWAGKDAPRPGTSTPPIQRAVPMPMAPLTQLVPVRSAIADAAVQSRAPAPAAYALAGVRPRKQSLHVEPGDRGTSVWVRDATLNSQQAHHLAAAIVANLEVGGQQLAALYLNGRALVDGPKTITSLSSSPNPSE